MVFFFPMRFFGGNFFHVVVLLVFFVELREMQVWVIRGLGLVGWTGRYVNRFM